MSSLEKVNKLYFDVHLQRKVSRILIRMEEPLSFDCIVWPNRKNNEVNNVVILRILKVKKTLFEKNRFKGTKILNISHLFPG